VQRPPLPPVSNTQQLVFLQIGRIQLYIHLYNPLAELKSESMFDSANRLLINKLVQEL
jgi:hypothetical protein